MGCNRITNCLAVVLLALLLTSSSLAAPKPHVISFGKWMPVQWMVGTNGDDEQVSIKIRALVVDGRVREYVVGPPHEVTERLFVVRRVFRVNDALPEDAAPKWQWQRGGWLLVDRLTRRISAVTLPEFDVVYSASSWHRDYVAYCGVSDDGKKTFAIVAQLNRKKPVLKKPLLASPARRRWPGLRLLRARLAAIPNPRQLRRPGLGQANLRHPRSHCGHSE
jgi:hypothetical protein